MAGNLIYSKYILPFNDLNLNSGLSTKTFQRNVPVDSGVDFVSPYVGCTTSSTGLRADTAALCQQHCTLAKELFMGPVYFLHSPRRERSLWPLCPQERTIKVMYIQVQGCRGGGEVGGGVNFQLLSFKINSGNTLEAIVLKKRFLTLQRPEAKKKRGGPEAKESKYKVNAKNNIFED